ncbi:phytosulfokines 3-like [Rutidosis leptorrhynchoides]|uniref:phytosulfokines 3-like n=1 Tax=Rutidosis leptorrhynchoides TaxID=125765 RepID=UPI003A99BEBD
MSRNTIIFLILALLFCSTSSYAARLTPSVTAMPDNQNKGGEDIEFEQGCEGISEQECILGKTLLAHIDYIYTQDTTP